MEKIQVRRDHLMYLIRELDSVRRDNQGLADRVSHVHSCLCAIAGADAIEDGRRLREQSDIALAKRIQGICEEWFERQKRPSGVIFRC